MLVPCLKKFQLELTDLTGDDKSGLPCARFFVFRFTVNEILVGSRVFADEVTP